jgi:hypothetical protein
MHSPLYASAPKKVAAVVPPLFLKVTAKQSVGCDLLLVLENLKASCLGSMLDSIENIYIAINNLAGGC